MTIDDHNDDDDDDEDRPHTFSLPSSRALDFGFGLRNYSSRRRRRLRRRRNTSENLQPNLFGRPFLAAKYPKSFERRDEPRADRQRLIELTLDERALVGRILIELPASLPQLNSFDDSLTSCSSIADETFSLNS